MYQRLLHGLYSSRSWSGLLGVLLTSLSAPSAAQRVDVYGIATDGDGVPVAGVEVVHDNVIVAVTGTDGTFQGSVALAGDTVFVARRLGYEPTTATGFIDVDGAIRLHFTLAGRPVGLAEVAIRGEIAPRWAGGFERRRLNSPGHFFTREDIQRMQAQVLTDILRRVPGAYVLSEDNVTVEAGNLTWSGRVTVHFLRSGAIGRAGPCEPTLFVNNVVTKPHNIDMVAPADQIAALEVYVGAMVPAEYRSRSPVSSRCGAMVIWTDGPIEGGLGTDWDIGLVYGVSVAGGNEWTGETGVTAMFPIGGGMFQTRVAVAAVRGERANAPSPRWRFGGEILIRPTGRQGLLYVGVGVEAVKYKVDFDRALAVSPLVGQFTLRVNDVLSIGLSGYSTRLRPLLGIQLAGIMSSINTRMQIMFGVTVRIGP